MEVPPGAARCPNCGMPQGLIEPCPSCNAQAGTSPHPEFRWVCDVCGAPRVPKADPALRFSGREAPFLRKADAARKARAGWRGAAIATGLLLPFLLAIFLVLTLLFGVSFGLIIAALFAAAPVGAFLAFALSKASARGREIGPAIDAAWLSAATDAAAQARGPVSARKLAAMLGVEEPQAEELVALLDVNEALSPGPRVRIAPPSSPLGAAPTAPTQVAGAEDEAALIEQLAADEESQRRKGTL